MINKFVSSVTEALAGTPDGATVMIGGFGTAGIPDELIAGLLAQGARDLRAAVAAGAPKIGQYHAALAFA